MQKDDATKSSSFVPGDCNRICVPSIQPTTFGNADLASNFAFVLVDGSCPCIYDVVFDSVFRDEIEQREPPFIMLTLSVR